MTEKRFTLFDDGETIFDNESVADDGGKEIYWLVEYGQKVKLVELLNKQHETIQQLNQFQNDVAEVINGKMGDNVCNDYKMEVLKEIWEELNLDDVWFE